MRQSIAIVGGTGAEGTGLALRFARAGADVRIGSRNRERAQEVARNVAEKAAAGSVQGFDNADAVSGAAIVVLTVPPDAQIETLRALAGSFQPGAILIDATVRLRSEENSALLAAANVPPGVQVAATFHTLSAGLVADLDHPIDSDVMICAAGPEAKAAARTLVEMLPGARPIDAGGLGQSRLVENTVQLLIAVNRANKSKHAGIRITGL